MQLQFHGAVRTVTGSCFLLKVGDRRILIDCGMYQGSNALERRNEQPFPFAPRSIDYVLCTHAHIDHIGLIPKLVKDGFSGTIIGTRATVDLLPLMLKDSAHIQEKEAEWANRKAARSGKPQIEPIYTMEDAEAACELAQEVRYNEEVNVCEGLKVIFRDAGHILGSSFIEAWVTENNATKKIIFSGDLGNMDQAIIKDPQFAEEADLLLVESTYGDRLHKPRAETMNELEEILDMAYRERGNVVIPAFAVGRTQEILYNLHRLHTEGRLPPFKIFVDSPMAISATGIYRKHSECFDYETVQMLTNGEGPLELPDLRFTRETKESQEINFVTEPSLIISASGMCNAGRILHHLKHNLWRRNSHVAFVGYQANGSLGARIIQGVPRVKIFGEDIAIAAHIHTIGGLSAHADQKILKDWVSKIAPSKPLVYVVHGEEASSEAFARLIRKDMGLEARLPLFHEELDLTTL